jgi:hypothetical protein
MLAAPWSTGTLTSCCFDAVSLYMPSGIEPANELSQTFAKQQLTEPQSEVSALCLHSGSINSRNMAVTDSELMQIIEAWPLLSIATRRAMLAVCLDALLIDTVEDE